jgi:hypothetical protein
MGHVVCARILPLDSKGRRINTAKGTWDGGKKKREMEMERWGIGKGEKTIRAQQWTKLLLDFIFFNLQGNGPW